MNSQYSWRETGEREFQKTIHRTNNACKLTNGSSSKANHAWMSTKTGIKIPARMSISFSPYSNHLLSLCFCEILQRWYMSSQKHTYQCMNTHTANSHMFIRECNSIQFVNAEQNYKASMMEVCTINRRPRHVPRL